ncbi:hypothetical protein [Stenotrophomonas maltophilia]|nr:hypothetical protein [Stenotrophomonas maltophilia]
MKLLAIGMGMLLTGVAGASSVTDDSLVIMADEQVRATQVAMQLATIKSELQLQNYLMTSPKEISAFSEMQPTELRRFVSSLTFNEKGLTGFDPTPLRTLTPTQVYRILALFGMQSGTSKIGAVPSSKVDEAINVAPLGIGGGQFPVIDFLEGYRCEGQHTCRESPRAACTSNC